MTRDNKLVLPVSYEGILSELGQRGDVRARLMEFVQPVEKAEAEIATINAELHGSGCAVFLYGPAGSGKSTFMESLSWRPHLEIATPVRVNATEFPQEALLSRLGDALRQLAGELKAPAGKRPCVVIDYLEHLDGQAEADVRSFFRTLNGILRQSPMLVLWPVTDRADAESMLKHASAVSGTVFPRGKEIVDFAGPPKSLFPSIASQTISVLNDGLTVEEFNLTPEDLEDLADRPTSDGTNLTIRTYLERVNKRWRDTSGFIEKIHNRVPRPTEVWFVFSHPDAEAVLSQFVRKTKRLTSAWTALHAKLYEYIHDNQRATDWSPKRLQLAIGGALTTRMLFLPTNALVCTVAAYAPDAVNRAGIDESEIPASWRKKSTAVDRMNVSPLVRQLRGEEPKMGMRRSGPAARAVEKAEPPFQKLSSWTSGSGSGSDRTLNRAVAEVLRDALQLDESDVVPEARHPWLPNIIPDIRFDADPSRHICIEFSYTNRREPHVVADYALGKLDRYMRELEGIVDDLGGYT